MRKSFKTVILILFNLSAFAQNQPLNVDGIVAAIGDQIILQSDIIFQKQALSQEGRVLSDCDMLKEISLEKLLIHHAAIDSVEVTNEEIDESIDRRIQQLVAQIGSERKMEEYYKKSILLIKEEMRPLMKNQMISQRMQMTVAENIQISPIEVEEMIQEMPVDSLPLIGTEVELAQIIIEPEVSKESITETIERLNTLRERILNGSSFSSMAILYSEDPGSNRNGGEYKGLKRGQFVKEFDSEDYGAAIKSLSMVIELHTPSPNHSTKDELFMYRHLIKGKIEDFEGALLDVKMAQSINPQGKFRDKTYPEWVTGGENKISSIESTISKEKAIAKLKELKELLELEVITQKDYDKEKAILTPIILGKN